MHVVQALFLPLMRLNWVLQGGFSKKELYAFRMLFQKQALL